MIKYNLLQATKHLGLILDSKIDFNYHINTKTNKCNKIIGMMKTFFLFRSRKTLLTIYKSFIWPNLDHENIIYHTPFNELFEKKIKLIQYHTSVITTGAI